MKVMIAEDNPSSGFLVARKILDWGHEVIHAADGAEAWDMVQDIDGLDLAVLDWEMPEMTGVELVKKLRSDERFKNIYVLMLTVREKTEDVMRSFEMGVDDFLSKPIEIEELKECIEKGKGVVDSKKPFNERQDQIMENIYIFLEKKGRFIR